MRRTWPAVALLALGVAVITALALVHGAEIRARAGEALERGMPAREAALARGFVLGQDERIDAGTVEDFRRAGLGHLLAVSGQNVALLALLAMPLLAALGLSLRARLAWILGLIVVYVGLAGAGPSIQRAGVMGALSVVATLSGRRASRLYALIVAAIVTLAVEPAIAADVGWQLSFAAVLGIFFFAAPLRRSFMAWIGSGAGGRLLVEGAALTVAATLATAPLVAHRFGAISTTTLLANLLVLPAVAPAMWLGMLAAMAGQVPGLPTEAFNAVNAPLLAYIAQVAAWCGRPSWAEVEVELDGPGVIACYFSILAAVGLATWLSYRRRIFAARRGGPAGRSNGARRLPLSTRRGAISLAVLVLLGAALTWPGADDGVGAGPPVRGLRISVLDVGQGDAILLQAAGEPAVLVDGGPPGPDLAEKLHGAGVESLGAAIVTHDQSDHAGGIVELLGEMPVKALLYARLDRSTTTAARAAGAAPRRIVAGSALRSGLLRLEVLWPPRELLASAVGEEDANRLSLVLLLRWGSFSMLLTGDTEAEATPLDPGPIDVLKVAHHGSEDAGLDDLLDRTRPDLAIVSVGAGNPFGHPTAATMAELAEHGVRRFRTDRNGTVVIDVDRHRFRVSGGD